MKSIDELLSQMGLTNPAHRTELSHQIELLAVETAIARLHQQGSLNDADQAAISRSTKTGIMDAEAMNQLFDSPERQLILQQSLTEALQIATTP